jgi:DNA-binding beta-propeller fold protein YncE
MSENQTSQGSTVDLLELLDDVAAPPQTPPPAPPADDGRRRRRRVLLIVLAALLVVFLGLFAWYLLNRKPLSELPGLSEARLPAYKTSFYGVNKPLGVAVSPDGSRIYATQSGSTPTTLVFDRDGTKVGELKPPPTPKTYHVPVYVAVNPANGDVYVGDRAAGKVYVYDAEGTYRSTVQPKGTDVKEISPLGLAVAADGTLYVADVLSPKPADHRILVLAPDGTLRAVLGKGQLNYPNAIVPGGSGEIYVSDSNDGRVVVIEGNGTLSTLVARGVGDGDLGLPRGLGIDDEGRMFVVDTTDHMGRLFTTGDSPTAHPTYVGSFGDEGRDDGKFTFPNGLATDSRGRVYVADRENNRIEVWGY